MHTVISQKWPFLRAQQKNEKTKYTLDELSRTISNWYKKLFPEKCSNSIIYRLSMFLLVWNPNIINNSTRYLKWKSFFYAWYKTTSYSDCTIPLSEHFPLILNTPRTFSFTYKLAWHSLFSVKYEQHRFFSQW